MGCAQANFTISLAEKQYKMVGLDLRHSFLQYAKLKVEENDERNLDFVVGNAQSIPVASESLDGVILCELLEHTSKPEAMINEAKRVLKPSGYLYISTPNGERLTTNRRRTYTNLKSIERNWKGIEFDPLNHVFEFLKDELGQLILSSDLEIVSIRYECIALGLVPVLCKVPLPVRLLRRIEDILVRLPIIQRKIAGVLICVCRKTRT